MTAGGDDTLLERLSREECLQLLASLSIGRVAVAEPGGAPLVVPVNYALVGEVIVFRTDPGSKLEALREHPASFQVDFIDPVHRTGWSVLVQGIAYETSKAEIEVTPWDGGPKEHWVRIFPERSPGGAFASRRCRPSIAATCEPDGRWGQPRGPAGDTGARCRAGIGAGFRQPMRRSSAAPSRPALSSAVLAWRAGHGLIALGFLASIGYVWWCALTGRRGRPLRWAIAALAGEGVLVIANGGDCPLGPLGERIGDAVPLFELVLSPTAAKRAVPTLAAVTVVGLGVLAARSRKRHPGPDGEPALR